MAYDLGELVSKPDSDHSIGIHLFRSSGESRTAPVAFVVLGCPNWLVRGPCQRVLEEKCEESPRHKGQLMKLSKSQKQRAIEQMQELMQYHPLDADGTAERWLDAEGMLDTYVSAAEERTAALPPRQQLAEALFYLISAVDLIRDDDNIQLISELLTPEFGIELYGLLPRIKRLFIEAQEKLSALAEVERKVGNSRHFTDFDLF